MSFDEERMTRLEMAKDFIAGLTEVDTHRLAREELETASFADFEADIFDFAQSVRALASLHLSALPSPHLLTTLEMSREMLKRAKRMLDFKPLALPTGANIANERDTIGRDLADHLRHFWSEMARVFAFHATLPIKAVEAEKSAADIARNLQDQLDEVKELAGTAQALKKQSEETLEILRQTAGATGAWAHAEHFKSEAKANGDEAKRWAGRLVWGASILGLLLVGNVVLVWYKPTENSQAVSLIFAKILLFSVAISAVLWLGRMYRAARHNQQVNQHRYNALGTFEAFVKGASDEQTKNAVLIQAAQSVFAAQATGFIHSEGEGGSPVQLIEMVRSISPTPK